MLGSHRKPTLRFQSDRLTGRAEEQSDSYWQMESADHPIVSLTIRLSRNRCVSLFNTEC